MRIGNSFKTATGVKTLLLTVDKLLRLVSEIRNVDCLNMATSQRSLQWTVV
jgi:hypothetical protein